MLEFREKYCKLVDSIIIWYRMVVLYIKVSCIDYNYRDTGIVIIENVLTIIEQQQVSKRWYSLEIMALFSTLGNSSFIDIMRLKADIKVEFSSKSA